MLSHAHPLFVGVCLVNINLSPITDDRSGKTSPPIGPTHRARPGFVLLSFAIATRPHGNHRWWGGGPSPGGRGHPEDHASSQGEQEGHLAKWDPVPWGTGSQGHLPEAVTTGCSEMEVDQQRGSWNPEHRGWCGEGLHLVLEDAAVGAGPASPGPSVTTLQSLGCLGGDLKEQVESRSGQAALDPWMEGLEGFTLDVPRASLGREPGLPAPPWEFTGRKGDLPLLAEACWDPGRGDGNRYT